MSAAACARPAEYWVARVLLHEGRKVQLDMMTPGAWIATVALINTGDLMQLPDGSIAEPVEVFGTELAARVHREKLLRDNPGQDYRVVLNADA